VRWRQRARVGAGVFALPGLLALSGPLRAADLASDCCADLEERVAELERMTARKGNEKVSLEISGLVNQALLGWHDGKDADVYEVTNDNERTRFRFKGKAKIDKEWETGYLFEVGIRSANSKRVNQLNFKGDDNPDDVGFDLRDAYWYAKSKHLGTVILGISTAATEKITESNVTQTSAFAKYSDVEDTGLGMFLRSAVNGRLTESDITWRRLIGDSGDQPGEGERGFNIAKYETPVLHGFWLTAALGAADFWDVALRYKGELQGFEVQAGVGYLELLTGSTIPMCAAEEVDEALFPTVVGLEDDGTFIVEEFEQPNTDCHQYGGSFSILHERTGLFLNFGTGLKVDDFLDQTTRFAGTDADPDQFFWAAQAGIEKKFFNLGKTTVYAEYYDYDGGSATRRTVEAGDALNPTGVGDWAVWYSAVNLWGVGFAQGIDDAAMVLYFSYRHVEGELVLRQLNGDVANGPIAGAPIDDLDVAITGAVIKF
jgi:hypothetical protein